MNRETWRDIKRMNWREAEKAIHEVYDPYVSQASQYAYNNAWTSMMLALVDRFPELMTKEILHSVAVDTLEISNGVDVPSILAERLKERTGFDILEATDESDLPYIPKEAQDGR